jgi:hypothetical protein
MLISCEGANVTSVHGPTNQPQELNSGINKQDFEKLIKTLRKFALSQDVINKVAPLVITNKIQLIWPCEDCRRLNSIKDILCKGCSEPIPGCPDIAWACKHCNHLNDIYIKTCEKCCTEGLECIDSTKKFHQGETKQKECPVCFEEEKFQKQGQHDCKQCKKAICESCYQDILKTKNKLCPLCRYENY